MKLTRKHLAAPVNESFIGNECGFDNSVNDSILVLRIWKIPLIFVFEQTNDELGVRDNAHIIRFL